MTMGDPNLHRVICTYVGALLDPCSAEKGNCSVNNHAVICILFVVHNWQRVSFQKMSERGEYEADESIVNDCDRCFFTIKCQKKRKTIMYFINHVVLT